MIGLLTRAWKIPYSLNFKWCLSDLQSDQNQGDVIPNCRFEGNIVGSEIEGFHQALEIRQDCRVGGS